MSCDESSGGDIRRWENYLTTHPLRRPMVLRLVGEVLEEVKTPLYRNAIYLMVNTASVAGIGFLFWVVAARIFPEDVVNADLILIQAATYLGILSSLGFGHGLIRFLPTTAEDPEKMVNSCLTLSLLFSLGLSGVFVAGVHQRYWYTQGLNVLPDPLEILGFLIFVLLFVPLPLLDYLFIARRSASLAALKSFILQVAKFVLLIIFYFVYRHHAIILGYAVGVAVALGIAFFALIPNVIPGYRPRPALNIPILRSLFRFSFLSHMTEILALAPGVVLLLMVDKIFLPESGIAAAFGITWLIVGTAILVIPAAATTSLFAEGSHEEDLGRDVRRTLRFVLPLLGLTTGVILLFGEFILKFFGDTYAANGLRLLRILAISGLFYTFNSVYMAVKRVEKRMVLVVAMMTFATGVTIGLSYLYLPSTRDIAVTGYAWLLGQGLLSLAIALHLLVGRFVRRASPARGLPKGRPAGSDGRRP